MRPARRLGPGYLVEPLAPPVIWIAYFMVVYLFAEAACAAGWSGIEALGLSGVSLVTIAVTIGTAALIGYFTWRSWRRWQNPAAGSAMERQTRSLGLIGFLSGLLFMVATIAVGLPAMVLQPC